MDGENGNEEGSSFGDRKCIAAVWGRGRSRRNILETAWVASLELPSLILTGVYLVLSVIYGISSAKRFKGTKFRSFAKKCEEIALFALAADLALETALHLAGI